MSTLVLIGRCLLAAVFAVAASTKVFDRPGTRAAAEGFGVPVRLSDGVARLLPAAEFAVAGTLLVPVTARWGAIGAAGLLTIFIAAMARSIARGEAPDCHCFGALHSEPVGKRALLRNGVLAAAAVFVVVGGWNDSGPSAVSWIGHLSAAGTVAVAAGGAIALTAAATAVGLLALVRQNGRLLLRVDALERRLDLVGAPSSAPTELAAPRPGLAVGTPAPAFTLPGLYGEHVTLESLLASELPVLLLFTDPGCGPCNALMPQIGVWRHEHATALTIAVVSRGATNENRAKAREHGLGSILLDDDLSVYRSFEIPATPAAVLIDPAGRIASHAAAGADDIASVVAGASGGQLAVIPPQPAPVAPQASSLTVGSDAPPIDLPDLNGERVVVATDSGDTLVLFWNPGCGFCQQMLDDLRSWEADPPPGAPRLLLVSTGSVEDNHAQNLRASIVLDQAFHVASTFGAGGTPSGLLVDRHGKIASSLAVGAPAVMSLTKGRDESRNGLRS